MAEQVAIKPDPALKPDPDAMDDASPMAVDAYEDDVGDLDLDFYSPVDANGNQSAQDQLFMARVPTYVWAAWDKIDDDTPIEIGKLRVWSEPDKKQGTKVRPLPQSFPSCYNERVGLYVSTFIHTVAENEAATPEQCPYPSRSSPRIRSRRHRFGRKEHLHI